MKRPIEFHRLVQTEIDRAFGWYERKQSGLGTQFLDELDAVFSSISENPEQFGLAREDV